MSTSTKPLTEAGQRLGYNGGLTIAFQVKDLARSLAWYRDVLGFKVAYHIEEIGWCELTTGVERVQIGLSQVEDPNPGGPTPTFGVHDIDEARRQLEQHGVRFDGPTREIPGMVKLATFFDPDENTLMFSQALSSEFAE